MVSLMLAFVEYEKQKYNKKNNSQNIIWEWKVGLGCCFYYIIHAFLAHFSISHDDAAAAASTRGTQYSSSPSVFIFLFCKDVYVAVDCVVVVCWILNSWGCDVRRERGFRAIAAFKQLDVENMCINGYTVGSWRVFCCEEGGGGKVHSGQTKKKKTKNKKKNKCRVVHKIHPWTKGQQSKKYTKKKLTVFISRLLWGWV